MAIISLNNNFKKFHLSRNQKSKQLLICYCWHLRFGP